MPQRPKPEIQARIVQAATDRFLAAGYRDASLRQIATDAATSLGNLRAYFPSKDRLFEATCGPVAQTIDLALEQALALPVHGDDAFRQRLDAALVQTVIDFIVIHRPALRLLLDHSGGSSRSGWRDDLLGRYIELEQKRLGAFLEHHGDALARVPSPRVVGLVCRMYFGLAEDFVRGLLDEAELRATVAELDAFRHAGVDAYRRKTP